MLRKRGLGRLSAYALVALVLCADPAHVNAQDGIIVDPDRPAGTEYVIPLESARQGATPESSEAGSGRGSQAEPAPAFGEGVAGGAGTRRRRARAARATTKPPGIASGDTASAVAALSSPTDGGIPVALITAGIALSVLLFAGAARLARRSRA
jgi:hypothetical protein